MNQEPNMLTNERVCSAVFRYDKKDGERVELTFFERTWLIFQEK